jgi:flagellin-like hook-associated protein FlgL
MIFTVNPQFLRYINQREKIMKKITKQILMTYLLLLILFAGINSNTFGRNDANKMNQQNLMNESLSTQTELNGLYLFKGKDGENKFNFMFKFQSEGVVLYSYEYKGAATIKGSWSVENDVVTVSLPKDDSNLVFKFKRNGDALEVTEKPVDVPIVTVGTLFTKAIDTPSGPTFSAQEISDRVLKFAKSIKTVKDISPKNIKRKMGIKVNFNEEDRTNYGFWGKVTDSSWIYGLVAYPYPSAKNKTTDTVRFTFDNETENADMKGACVDLESYRKDLKQAGFSYTNAYSVHSMMRGLIFSRNNLFIDVYVERYGSNFENIKNDCVQMIIISVANAGKK